MEITLDDRPQLGAATEHDGPSASSGRLTDRVFSALRQLGMPEIRAVSDTYMANYRLLETNGDWFSPEFGHIQKRFFSTDVTGEDLACFFCAMLDAANRNPYLVDFLQRVRTQAHAGLMEKLEGNVDLLPRFVIYALVLDRLTRALRSDSRFLSCMQRRWRSHRSNRLLQENIGVIKVFALLKLHTLDRHIAKIIRCQETNLLPPKSWQVFFNIVEAAFFDLLRGNRDNARVAWILARASLPTTRSDRQTGKGPNAWSRLDGGIDYALPFARNWADLYTAWNLAFVSNLDSCLFTAVKLLIPSVTAYQIEPETYIYNRSLSLYAHINHAALARYEKGRFSDVSLTRLFGQVNLQSARHYLHLLRVR